MTAAVLGAAVSVLSGNAAPASAAGSPGMRYVALGDSYASGAGLGTVKDAECQRSDSGYPSTVSGVYKPASFTDVTCSGATTRSMWNYQGSKPPQVKALTADTTHVTVSIGGNDIGFAEIIRNCAIRSFSDPAGDPCKDFYTKGGTDQLAQRVINLSPRIASVLTDIKRRSPKAKVAVIGYPSLVPSNGARCRPAVPFADGDVAYLRDINVQLNAMLAAQARQAGVVYVDTYKGTAGHDMCQPANKRWIEPLNTPGMPAHPNSIGQLIMAWAVTEGLR
ncbi:SGNH/GDSL hydrolase family protein [Streptomyces sp. NPDC001177]